MEGGWWPPSGQIPIHVVYGTREPDKSSFCQFYKCRSESSLDLTDLTDQQNKRMTLFRFVLSLVSGIGDH